MTKSTVTNERLAQLADTKMICKCSDEEYQAMASELLAARDAQGVPEDFITHENSWRRALERLIELEPESHEPDSDEKGFWQHELSAFNRAYSELNACRAAMLKLSGNSE